MCPPRSIEEDTDNQLCSILNMTLTIVCVDILYSIQLDIECMVNTSTLNNMLNPAHTLEKEQQC